MVSGTDEHGTPGMVAADKEGKSYAEIADYYNAAFREDFRRLGLSYDCFSRTTTLNHERVTQDFFKTLYEHRAPRDSRRSGTCPRCSGRAACGDQCDNCGNQL